MTGALTGNLTGNVVGNVTGDVTGNLTGNVVVVMSGSTLGQLLAMAINAENVLGFKATNPFVLADGSENLGYRYGGNAGDGSYGAPHYFKGNVIIDGDLTVTGTIINGGA